MILKDPTQWFLASEDVQYEKMRSSCKSSQQFETHLNRCSQSRVVHDMTEIANSEILIIHNLNNE